MIKGYVIIVLLLVSCKKSAEDSPQGSTTIRALDNMLPIKEMSVLEVEKLFNQKIDLKRVATSKRLSDIDQNTPLYISNFHKKGIQHSFSFNKFNRLLTYSQRIIYTLNDKEQPVLLEKAKHNMLYSEISKLYPSKKTELIKIAPNFTDQHPPNTVCYLYHYKDITFEFDRDKKLMSLRKIILE